MPTGSPSRSRSAPGVGSPSRPGNSEGPSALTRILYLHQRLARGDRLDAVRVARGLEVSPRTVKRDIERLRDFHGAPIEWDRTRHTYYYSRPCKELPLVHLTAEEAFALALASDTFAAWRGTPLGRAVASAFAKIGGTLGDAISLPASELAGLITPATEGPDTHAEPTTKRPRPQ